MVRNICLKMEFPCFIVLLHDTPVDKTMPELFW